MFIHFLEVEFSWNVSHADPCSFIFIHVHPFSRSWTCPLGHSRRDRARWFDRTVWIWADWAESEWKPWNSSASHVDLAKFSHWLAVPERTPPRPQDKSARKEAMAYQEENHNVDSFWLFVWKSSVNEVTSVCVPCCRSFTKFRAGGQLVCDPSANGGSRHCSFAPRELRCGTASPPWRTSRISRSYCRKLSAAATACCFTTLIKRSIWPPLSSYRTRSGTRQLRLRRMGNAFPWGNAH